MSRELQKVGVCLAAVQEVRSPRSSKRRGRGDEMVIGGEKLGVEANLFGKKTDFSCLFRSAKTAEASKVVNEDKIRFVQYSDSSGRFVRP